MVRHRRVVGRAFGRCIHLEHDGCIDQQLMLRADAVCDRWAAAMAEPRYRMHQLGVSIDSSAVSWAETPTRRQPGPPILG